MTMITDVPLTRTAIDELESEPAFLSSAEHAASSVAGLSGFRPAPIECKGKPYARIGINPLSVW